eukprot:119426-Lingulodinium_polyedra.AAC.1
MPLLAGVAGLRAGQRLSGASLWLTSGPVLGRPGHSLSLCNGSQRVTGCWTAAPDSRAVALGR